MRRPDAARDGSEHLSAVFSLLDEHAGPGALVSVGVDGEFERVASQRGRTVSPVEFGADPERLSAALTAPVAAVVVAGGVDGTQSVHAFISWMREVIEALGNVPLVWSLPGAVPFTHRTTGFGEVDRSATPAIADVAAVLDTACRSGFRTVAQRRVEPSPAPRPSAAKFDHAAALPVLVEYVEAVGAAASAASRARRDVRMLELRGPVEPLRPAEPFLSVLVRTQGHRASLEEALTCLAAQSDDDFEVILTVHSDDADAVDDVRRRVRAFHPAFAERVRVEPVTTRGRAAPLNRGLELARGRYLAFLDDDDLVTADWVATYRRADALGPARVLRSQCAVQDHERTPGGLIPFAPTDGFETPFNTYFELIQHRQLNQTPICAWAVPVESAHRLGLRFDAELAVCEDWEFLVRAAELFGVSNVIQYTSVYRRFTDGWGSMGSHAQEEWDATARLIRDRLDRRPCLVPAGEIEPTSLRREDSTHLSAVYRNARRRIADLERSRYWRMTKPLRWFTGLRGDHLSRLRHSLVRRRR